MNAARSVDLDKISHGSDASVLDASFAVQNNATGV